MAKFYSLDALTTDERIAWIERDQEEFEQWHSRMVEVDLQSILKKKKTPRHRFNKDPYKP